jgi:hypothetical protein
MPLHNEAVLSPLCCLERRLNVWINMGIWVWENAMRSMLVTYCTAATTLAAVTFLALPPAKAMTIATPTGLSAAIQQADVKQDVRCVCGRRAYYRPYYSYAYAYRPYYAYAYTYRPYYAYTYTYRPYYAYAYRPYYAYAYAGYGRRHWIGWR